MRFALIGEHPLGLETANALREVGRHELGAYSGPAAGLAWLEQRGCAAVQHPDAEAVLALPDIDVVIVAAAYDERADVLRRAVRSEHHVLCVHPADSLPDVTYEAALLAEESRKRLLPILLPRYNPGLHQAREIAQQGLLGTLSSVEAEFRLPEAASQTPPPQTAKNRRRRSQRPEGNWDSSPLLTLWDALRFLLGDVAEVSAIGVDGDALKPTSPLTLTGRFQSGALFQVLLRAGPSAEDRLCLRGTTDSATLSGAILGPGRCELVCRRLGENPTTWNWQPWPQLVQDLEAALAGKRTTIEWQDATRCLELFEAAQQSVKRKRVIPLQYEEFSEEANFKTVMTTLGCLTLLLVLAVFIALLALGAPLGPWSLYLLLPLLLLFLILQALGWIVPRQQRQRSA